MPLSRKSDGEAQGVGLDAGLAWRCGLGLGRPGRVAEEGIYSRADTPNTRKPGKAVEIIDCLSNDPWFVMDILCFITQQPSSKSLTARSG